MALLGMTSQHIYFDEVCLPWVLDRNLGPVIARKPLSGGEGDVGDGMFVYRWTPEGVVKAPTTTPNRAREIFQARRRRHEETMRAIDALMDEWGSERNACHEDGEVDMDFFTEDTDNSVEPSFQDYPNRPTPPTYAHMSDQQLIDLCTVHRTARRDGSRFDVRVTTPDGSVFRSIASTIRYLRAY